MSLRVKKLIDKKDFDPDPMPVPYWMRKSKPPIPIHSDREILESLKEHNGNITKAAKAAADHWKRLADQSRDYNNEMGNEPGSGYYADPTWMDAAAKNHQSIADSINDEP